MNDFVNRLKTKLLHARKERDEFHKGLLSTLVGEIETEANKTSKTFTEKDCHRVIRNMIGSNKESISKMQTALDNGSQESYADRIQSLNRENTVLESYLPTLLSQGAIEEFLGKVDPDYSQIRSADNEGQAMKLAMRALQAANMSVNGNDVKAVIDEVRNRA